MEEENSSSLPRLYLCTVDIYQLRLGFPSPYSIQAIKISDLFSFSEAPLFKLKPGDDDEYHARREVDFGESKDEFSVPSDMGVGVFGSRIVFAGGVLYPRRLHSNRVYALDTKREQFNTVAAAGDDDDDDDHFSANIPLLQSPKVHPKLMEIKGKLYALDLWFVLAHYQDIAYHCFELFDPEVGSWVSLPDPPTQIMQGHGHLSYLVAGTKIFIANYQTPAYCFDVECPTENWKEVSFLYSSCLPDGFDQNRQLLEWDSIHLDLGDHMLVVYIRFEKLHFFRLRVRKNGTLVLHDVATMKVNVNFDPSIRLTYLGGGTICCVFMDRIRGLDVRGVIFTFKISFSRSVDADAAGLASITPGSGADPYFRIVYPSKSLGNSFSAKTLGWRTFEYQFPDTERVRSLRYSRVAGLAVLPHHRNISYLVTSMCLVYCSVLNRETRKFLLDID